MPREIVIQADPDAWTLVPASDDPREWVEQQAARAPEGARDRVAEAARLAAAHRSGSGLGLALFLSVPQDELFGMLGIVVLDDVPAPEDASGAAEVVEALLPSPWPAEILAIALGHTRGWRGTVLDPDEAAGDSAVALPRTVSTAYVLELRGRCAVAALTPLTPLAAAAAQVLAERALTTLDVVDAGGSTAQRRDEDAIHGR
ncbi:hypothetical protein [Microbacterium sp. CPCC 204701]|uniref:hypothetical protein n=1 Tax=Microbacterium sp. CPCC 204701 TaxID=2493084 RepID=UPI000FD6FEBD|nr:hypothetical protein [Microbacterium sp. CPCC 204701]